MEQGEYPREAAKEQPFANCDQCDKRMPACVLNRVSHEDGAVLLLCDECFNKANNPPPKKPSMIPCEECKRKTLIDDAMLITSGDKDIQVCPSCYGKRMNGAVIETRDGQFRVIDNKGRYKRIYNARESAEAYLARCRGQWARHSKPVAKKPTKPRFVPPSHFAPKPRQMSFTGTQPLYHHITYPDGPDAATWRGCAKGEHLFDEVVNGSDHYLYCDACGMEVHISKIVTY